MPWLKGHSVDGSDEPLGDGLAVAEEARESTPHCLEPGCPAKTFEPCEYRDGHGHGCEATWCSRHIENFRGIAYCRRHVNVARELYRSNVLVYRPDYDNRALSLARWTSQDLDEWLREGLEDAGLHVELKLHAAELVGTDQASHGWECTWTVTPSEADSFTAAVAVLEADDRTVHLRVRDEEVYSGIPPWVESRVDDPDEDRRRRDVYYSELCAAMVEAIRKTL